jgi:hypothetical protein
MTARMYEVYFKVLPQYLYDSPKTDHEIPYSLYKSEIFSANKVMLLSSRLRYRAGCYTVSEDTAHTQTHLLGLLFVPQHKNAS